MTLPRVAGFAVAGFLALSGCAKHREQVPGSSLFKITVQLDWVPEPEHGGLYQAQAKGYFTQAGLDVNIVPGGPNGFVLQKVATDQADIGQSDSTNTLVALSQDL